MAPERGRARTARAVAVGLVTGLGTAATAGLPRDRTALAVGGVLGGAVAVGGVVSAARAGDEDVVPEAAGTPRDPRTARGLARATGLSLGVGALLGAAVGASLWVELAVDAAAEGWLRRRGVPRPRLCLALGLGLAAGALEYLDGGDGAAGADGSGGASEAGASRALPGARPGPGPLDSVDA